MPVERTSSGPDFLSAFSLIQDQVACPVCHGALRAESERLVCTQCARTYPIIHGIPVLVPPSESAAS